ncbi:MAG TPA: protein kinase, partial [Planctomycetota bacterium]|nr:protein kinase [Planctomycetota bacterium]
MLLFVLVVTRGPDQGKKLPLEPGRTYTIGCNQDASLVLTDPLVLKGHCSLEVSDAGIVLKNHTATAGTFVGDQKVSQAALKANSTFRVGATVLGIAAAPAPAPKATPPAPPDPLVGRIIGGYKLNELVGVGGMGKVYRATQLSLHREVAFKILRDHHTKDKGFRDLFINEARAAAQLIHPNVVQVYDAGTEGDLVYFSMEFLGKGSIEEILEREKRIPWEQAILQVLEAAHGLAYAESKGIVHRDIKPDNLMLNEDGRVKIADLGLAKRGEGNDDAGVIGTPHFIPPEQALGKEVDHRADIYSLGATFFRMITGTTLFTGKTAKEIVLKHIKEPPPAASSVDETVPDDLDLVLAKMLAKDPNQRYQSATDVIAALEEVCAHHGIKGAIIKKGVGKRVLIPLVLLLLVAAGAVYY